MTDVQRLMVADLIGKPLEALVIREGRTLRIEIFPSELPDGTA